jgi:hypothetical protein
MVVNPKYKGIKLPVSSWPLLDTYVPPGGFEPGNQCLAASPTPWQTLIANPVANMATVTLDLQFDISNSDTGCNTGQFPSYASVGTEIPGQTFILGFTSLADAEAYKLPVAELETQGGSTSGAKFTSSAGRSFAGPTNASLRAAVAMMKPDHTTGSWTVPYSQMDSSAAGKSAYPGTMLISTDVPTRGLTKSLARDYGEFLSFAAIAGQQPGFGNGQLPAGYMPMTAANGASKMLAYTRAAAADVTAQNGKVPTPGGGQTGGTPAHSSSPTPSTSTNTSAGSQPASSATTPATSQSPAPSTSQTLTTTPGPTNTQQIHTTADVHSSVSAAVLPLVLLLALIAATIAFGVWQMARPAEKK